MKTTPQARTLPGRRPHGFTLVELLVSMTVTVLIVALSAQMFNSAAYVANSNTQHLDADSQARLVFDRLASDVARMVVRPDVDYYFDKNTQNSKNDQFAFYSESTGYYPDGITDLAKKSDVSLVGYRVNASFQLERLSKALVWNGVDASASGTPSPGAVGDNDPPSPMVFLPKTLLETWPKIARADDGNNKYADYQVISDQVLRMETCYLVRSDATLAGTLGDKPYLAPHTTVSGMQDVVAIVVSMAVLDTRTRARATTQQLKDTANLLEDFVPSTPASNGGAPTVAVSPASAWKKKLSDEMDQSQPIVPKSMLAQIRIYERYFYVPRPL